MHPGWHLPGGGDIQPDKYAAAGYGNPNPNAHRVTNWFRIARHAYAYPTRGCHGNADAFGNPYRIAGNECPTGLCRQRVRQ
jgi:hypothetical protein